MMGPAIWCPEKNTRCVPQCPLHPLLQTLAQPYNATGHLSHIQGENFFFPTLNCQLFYQITQMDEVVDHRLPKSSNVRWNFHSRAINSVFEYRQDLIRCFESVRHSGDFARISFWNFKIR